jgi:L-aspartate oxidase
VAYGIDPATEPIPVSPAEHYMMGGIRTDLNGAPMFRDCWRAANAPAPAFTAPIV